MKIISALTGVTEHTVKFTRKINGLFFSVANASGYATPTGVKATLYIHSPETGNRYTAFDKVSLIKLAELASMDKESSISSTRTGTFSGASPEVISIVAAALNYKIDLTADGKGVALAPGEEWYLELTGLTSGDTYNCWALESSETTTLPIAYKVLTTGSLTNQRFNLAGFDRVFVDKAGSLSNIEIGDAFGNIKKELDELDAEIFNGFGAVYNHITQISAMVSSYSQNVGTYGYLIPFDGKTELQINCSGAAAIEVIAMKW